MGGKENRTMNKTKELDLRLLVLALMRKLWLIVLCAAIIGAAAFGYTKYFVTPMYHASVTIYVNNNRVNAEGNTATLTASDLSVAQRLVATYVITLKSDKVLNKVAQELDQNLSAAQIRSMISAEAVDQTEVFKVQITNADPVLAAKIANAIAKVAPEEISEIVVGSSTKIIDYATVPRSPSSPNVMRNTALGAIIGIALAAVIAILQELLDVRVREEQDVIRLSEAPILGRIPDFALDDKGDAYAEANKSKQEEKAVEK